MGHKPALKLKWIEKGGYWVSNAGTIFHITSGKENPYKGTVKDRNFYRACYPGSGRSSEPSFPDLLSAQVWLENKLLETTKKNAKALGYSLSLKE